MPRLYAAISMIYRGSNVDLDELKKTSYVSRRIDVFEEKQNRTAYWNWLKQPPAFTRVKLHKAKAPGSLRRLSVECNSRYWLSSGMVFGSFGFGIEDR